MELRRGVLKGHGAGSFTIALRLHADTKARRRAGPQRSLFVRERKEVQEVLWRLTLDHDDSIEASGAAIGGATDNASRPFAMSFRRALVTARSSIPS